MSELTKEQAQFLGQIFVEEVKKNAKELLDGLDDEDRAEMHPQAFAALETLSNIEGQFCDIWPKITKSINQLGWIAKMILGDAYALVKTLQGIGERIAEVLCNART